MNPGEGGGSEPVKPKFKPKASAKKKPTPPAPPPPSEIDYQAAIAKYRAGGGGSGDWRGGKGRGWGGGRGYEGRGQRFRWQDPRFGRGRDGRGGGRGRFDNGRGRGRGAFVPVGQDFFVGGGTSGPVAYTPTSSGSGGGWSRGGGGGGGRGSRGGGDTSESEEEVDRKKRLAKTEGGKEVSTIRGVAGDEEVEEVEDDDDDDEDMFGVGSGVESKSHGKKKRAKSKRGGVDPGTVANEEGGEDADNGAGGEGNGDVFSLMGMPGSGGHRPKSSRLPGMRVTGNVMSEEDPMRPVALPVTATAQAPGSRLFARGNKKEDLMEEEDSSFFFVQLPTKLPRPLREFQRVKRHEDPASASGAKGNAVKEEIGGAGAAGAVVDGGAKAKAKAAEVDGPPQEELSFDQGLLRMRSGKIGKLYVHQSGKARLVIGGVSFVVHPGLPVSFVEEGVSIDAKRKSFCSFGQVTKRVVCTPDFEQLYRRADEAGAGAVGPGEGFDGGLQAAGLGVDGFGGGSLKMEVD